MLIGDYEEHSINSHGQDWMVAWYPPGSTPTGKKHGSASICVTTDNQVVLISADGESWDFPAGRPEGTEEWEQTLRREVQEEACAVVTHARLLGFSRGRCVGGTELGLVLVRSVWRAEVELLDWQPKFETSHRKILDVAQAQQCLAPAWHRFWERAFFEAKLSQPTTG